MKTKPPSGTSRPRILRREDSLQSRLYRGICVRVLYECDGLEILRTEMDPGTVLDDADITKLDGVHFVIGGSPVFHVANQSSDLMPGDSITLHGGQHFTVSNPTSSRSSILSVLFKNASACHSAGALGQVPAKSPAREKEISR
jgi:mannose-6-phosphate isomerase-like protein (cupin superfamily)